MYQPNNPIIKHKVGLLNLAEELRNVSKACKIMGCCSRTPLATLQDGKQLWREKDLNQI